MRLRLILVCCLLAAQLAAHAQTPTPSPAAETVTISRAEFDALKAAVEKLQQELQQLRGQGAPPTAAAPTPVADEEAPPEAPPAEVSPGANAEPSGPDSGSSASAGHALSLPDISVIVQAKGKLSTDTRDDRRNRVRLSEAELAIQGYVYPNVKADAFIAMSPEEDESAQVEEAYLSYLSLRDGLTGYVGRRHVAFGRTNLVHCHSWLYAHQPLVLRNLVAEESLTGEGLAFSYLLPTSDKYFAQLEVGAYTGEGPGESADLPDIVAGPGAGFDDRFYTGRLWASHALSDRSELEVGGSYAQGPAAGYALSGDGTAHLSGLDVSYRHFGEGSSRLLLRGEQIWRRETVGSDSSTARGYYLFGNLRHNRYSSWGALYDWSEFPQAPDLHESAFSLIYTRQMSEQYYLRLQGTHGSRPGDGSYDEAWLQWVWGVGPHTHNLE